MNLSLDLMVNALPFAFALHNAEETIGMERWTHSLQSRFVKPVTTRQFGLAALIITLLGFAVVYARPLYPSDLAYHQMITGFAGMLWLNVFFPHVVATFKVGRYAPGVITAVAINLPLTSLLLPRLYDVAALSPTLIAKCMAVGTATAIALAFGLLRLGRSLM